MKVSRDNAGFKPRHHSAQKKPLSRVRISVEVRSQSLSIASTRSVTASVMAIRATEMYRRVPCSLALALPFSLAHRAFHMPPRTATRKRDQSGSKSG
jgi:hypothetical protein